MTVDAFLADHVERTGDDDARRLVERVGASTRAEAVAVAERHGYGEHVETIRLNPWSRGFGTAVAFAVLPAFFGILLLFRADGDVLALVGPASSSPRRRSGSWRSAKSGRGCC